MMDNYPKYFIQRIIKKEGQNCKLKDIPKERVKTVVIAYCEGTSKAIKRVLNHYDIKVIFQTNNTLNC